MVRQQVDSGQFPQTAAANKVLATLDSFIQGYSRCRGTLPPVVACTSSQLLTLKVQSGFVYRGVRLERC